MTGSMAVTGRLDDDVVREVRGHPDQPEKQQERGQTQTTPPQHESIVDGKPCLTTGCYSSSGGRRSRFVLLRTRLAPRRRSSTPL